jgi:hypothetical protein
MDQFVLDTPDFHRLYNCSFYSVDSVPLAKRQHVLLGVVLVLISVIEEVSFINFYHIS